MAKRIRCKACNYDEFLRSRIRGFDHFVGTMGYKPIRCGECGHRQYVHKDELPDVWFRESVKVRMAPKNLSDAPDPFS